MSWKYGLVKSWNSVFEAFEYAIHEIYYDINEFGDGWTRDPVTFHATSREQMIEVLEMALADIKAETEEDIEGR